MLNFSGSEEEATAMPGCEVALEPDPVVEAYKKDVDRTLLRENMEERARGEP